VDEFKREVAHNKLYSEVLRLYAICADEGVERYFDVDSEKNLGEKKRVLKLLNAGKDPDEIGRAYFDILEKLPHGGREGASW